MILFSVLLFVLAGAALVATGMGAGYFLRPKIDHPTKATPYECGEEPVGPAQVQFDLRFYIVALVYLVFAVEIVLFYPWAVAYGAFTTDSAGSQDEFTSRQMALVDMLVFFLLIMVGFAYLWRFGYLNWVRAIPKERK